MNFADINKEPTMDKIGYFVIYSLVIPLYQIVEQSLRFLMISLAMLVILTFTALRADPPLPFPEILAKLTTLKTVSFQCFCTAVGIWTATKITIAFLETCFCHIFGAKNTFEKKQ